MRQHWLVVQVSLDVRGEGAGRFVAAVAILLERLHDDPVKFSAKRMAEALGIRLALCRNRGQRLSQSTDPLAGRGRLLFADDAANVIIARRPQPLLGEGR